MITAIKPVFDRKTQTFSVDVRRDANVLLAHEGWLVFDNPVTVKASIEAGHMISHWTPRKRAAVLAWLNGQARGMVEVI